MPAVDDPPNMKTPLIQSSNPRLISAEQLALMLGISKRTLWRLRSAGRLPQSVRLGGSVRWPRDLICAWIEDGCPTTSIANRRPTNTSKRVTTTSTRIR